MTIEDNGMWTESLEFPQNRTLYVDQFTDRGSSSYNDHDVFQAVNLESVFDHFRPSKSIELRNENGEFVEETVSFNTIEDFEDEQLIGQSELLKAEMEKVDFYNGVVRQLERNKNLRNAVEDGSMRQGLKDILDSDHKAMKVFFLNDVAYAADRQKLDVVLGLWAELLAGGGATVAELIDTCKSLRAQAEQCLQENLSVIRAEILQLEVTYRTLETFFANAWQGDFEFLTLMNLNKEMLVSSESDGVAIVELELKKHYDALSLKNSFSLLVLPGYLGDAVVLRKWAALAYRNKVIMVTDFKDCHSFKAMKEELERSNFQGSDVQLSNTIMTCNYVLGRKKSEWANEDDDVFLPGSGALSGRLANTREVGIAQGVVGMDYGFLNNVKGTRLNLLKSEIAILIAYRVIPLVENNGKTFALSNRSLYDGSAISLQEYPIVRVLDWVNKVIMNFMHDIALETWDTYMSPKKLEKKIRDFLDHCRGYQLLFSNYKLAQPSQDPKTKIVTVDVSVTPFYSTKNLIIKLEADNKDYLKASTAVE